MLPFARFNRRWPRIAYTQQLLLTVIDHEKLRMKLALVEDSLQTRPARSYFASIGLIEVVLEHELVQGRTIW